MQWGGHISKSLKTCMCVSHFRWSVEQKTSRPGDVTHGWCIFLLSICTGPTLTWAFCYRVIYIAGVRLLSRLDRFLCVWLKLLAWLQSWYTITHCPSYAKTVLHVVGCSNVILVFLACVRNLFGVEVLRKIVFTMYRRGKTVTHFQQSQWIERWTERGRMYPIQ